MKFKDKDGELLDSIYDVWINVCSQNKCGYTCPLFISAVVFYPSTVNCREWARNNPIAAAHIMGYEVIEEEGKSTMGQVKQGKPIKEWTLAECSKHCTEWIAAGKDCTACIFRDPHKPTICIFGTCPRDLNFNKLEKPRFTKEDIEIAKAIKVLIPEATVLQRGGISDKLYLVNDDRGFPADFLTSEKFPGLRAGESINLDDIIGEG